VIIEQVDAFDDEAFAEWYRPFHASEKTKWPDEPGWAEHEMRAMYRDTREFDIRIWVARDGAGLSVGCLDLTFPKLENHEVAYMLLAVDPEHERLGVGRALLERAEAVAKENGRKRILARVEEPLGAIEPRSLRFAAAAGYRVGRIDARRELFLPVAGGVLDAMVAEAAPHATDYDVVTWTGSCPEAIAPGRVELARVLSADAPHGTLEYEEENWDLDRLRNWEKHVADMDRDLLAAGAVERCSGRLVAFTEIGLPRAEPEIAYQFDTVVHPAHRGHRLGTLVKVANLRALMAHSPQTRRTQTHNAVDNEPMIRVNDAMGHKVVAIITGLQKDLA
jgi:GNAT superfamily N-acetyltransferase